MLMVRDFFIQVYWTPKHVFFLFFDWKNVYLFSISCYFACRCFCVYLLLIPFFNSCSQLWNDVIKLHFKVCVIIFEWYEISRKLFMEVCASPLHFVCQQISWNWKCLFAGWCWLNHVNCRCEVFFLTIFCNKISLIAKLEKKFIDSPIQYSFCNNSQGLKNHQPFNKEP